MILTVGRSVLHLDGADSHNGAKFSDWQQATLILDYHRWKDMGSPKVLTVRFEPGDHLNG